MHVITQALPCHATECISSLTDFHRFLLRPREHEDPLPGVCFGQRWHPAGLKKRANRNGESGAVESGDLNGFHLHTPIERKNERKEERGREGREREWGGRERRKGEDESPMEGELRLGLETRNLTIQ